MENGFIYNGFKFKNLKEFKAVQNLAIKNGFKSTKQFNMFLEQNYN